MKQHPPASVLCFGEVLWDILPDGMKPGGAPMNVAYHLHRNGIESDLITKVGADALGDKLLTELASSDLPTARCQRDQSRPTGTVVAKMDADQEMSYEIVAPVAWDFIAWEDGYRAAAAAADAVVFGSLVMRSGVSRRTLEKLLDAARYRVFDVNLRAPHYSREDIFSALGKTELLKLNQHELGVITAWTGKEPSADEAGNVARLREKFPVKGVIVTRGKDGATFYEGSQRYHHPAYRVRVADTVGAGDAFLAAFLAARFRGLDIPACLEAASVLGAFVATRKGACPEYHPREGLAFLTPEDLTAFLTR